MRIPKSAILSTALLVGLAVGGAATASAAAPAKPKAYGVCVSTKTGAMRLLEPNRLRKSQHGACRTGERKVYLPTKDAIPAIPAPPVTVVYKRGAAVETCTKTTDAVLTYSCVTVPAPSPSPTPTATS
ncbi:hypothetical protein [Nonomuraea sp. NPDC003804]|uniref:hypothetical protein n=1 Tax=Nonomuraea sp. NPDC003804 TaxID=3154547 RepID=UPI0033A0ECD0